MDANRSRYYQETAPRYAAPQATTGTVPSMRPVDHLENVFALGREGIDRGALFRHQDGHNPRIPDQVEHVVCQSMQSSSPISALGTHLTPYLQDSDRLLNIHHVPNNTQFSLFSSAPSLPPYPLVAVFGNNPHPQHSSATMHSSIDGQLTTPSFTPPIGPHPLYNREEPGPQLAGESDYPASESKAHFTMKMSPSPQATGSGDVNTQQINEPVDSQTTYTPDLKLFAQQMKSIFSAIIAGKVNKASDELLVASRMLVSSILPLELHFDDKTNHSGQLAMWRDFNHCWEALAQKQMDIIQEELRTALKAWDKLSTRRIVAMVNELVTMCDQIETLGLVDYEIGIWEEQIVLAFEICLDLMRQA